MEWTEELWSVQTGRASTVGRALHFEVLRKTRREKWWGGSPSHCCVADPDYLLISNHPQSKSIDRSFFLIDEENENEDWLIIQGHLAKHVGRSVFKSTVLWDLSSSFVTLNMLSPFLCLSFFPCNIRINHAYLIPTSYEDQMKYYLQRIRMLLSVSVMVRRHLCSFLW